MKHYHIPLEIFLSSLHTQQKMREALHALFTPAERKEFELRLEILRRLSMGESQRSVAALLGVGLATVSRGARVLQYDQPSIGKLLRKVGNNFF